MSAHNLEVHQPKNLFEDSDSTRRELLAHLEDAIDLASDQDQMTWLTDHGKRIAAIVPVDGGERYAARFAALSQPDPIAELVSRLPVSEWGADELGTLANWLTEHGYDIGGD